MTPPKFLYFDLGNVVLHFDHEVMFQQMGEVAGIGAARVRDVLFDGGLQADFELGRISERQFYEAFCQRTGTRPDYDALVLAGSDIFALNVSLLPVVAQLQSARYRLGILSNTCRSHWEHCTRRFRIVAEAFGVHALSCEIQAGKPQAAIYEAAARLAGVAPEEIFFADDNPQNVAGAVAAGFDAVEYTSTPQLTGELRKRGLRFNY
jgi:HAD superfamily hydrolase (TIGR01509 family)